MITNLLVYIVFHSALFIRRPKCFIFPPGGELELNYMLYCTRPLFIISCESPAQRIQNESALYQSARGFSHSLQEELARLDMS